MTKLTFSPRFAVYPAVYVQCGCVGPHRRPSFYVRHATADSGQVGPQSAHRRARAGARIEDGLYRASFTYLVYHFTYLVVYPYSTESSTRSRDPITTSLMVQTRSVSVCLSLSTCTSLHLWKDHAGLTVSALKEQLPPIFHARRSSSALAPSCPKQGRRPPPC